MRGAQGHRTLRTVCTPGRHVASAAPGVHPPQRLKKGFLRLEWVTPWLPASPDQPQVSPKGNTWPSRSPGEGRASHALLARPGARYPQGLSTRGRADTGGAAPRRKRAAWGAKGPWCLGTSGAQPDAALLQLRAQNRVGHTGGWKERRTAASQTGGSQGERRTETWG